MAELPKSASCQVCGRARQLTTVGSITQWISTCACEQLDEREGFARSVRICAFCQRRIDPGRQGSMTQWVFQSEYCQCDRQNPRFQVPEPGSELSTYKQAAFEGFRDSGEDEEELELNADQFPVDRYKPVAKAGEGATETVKTFSVHWRALE